MDQLPHRPAVRAGQRRRRHLRRRPRRRRHRRPSRSASSSGSCVGKLVGVAGAIALAVRLGIGRLPDGVTTRHVLGMAAIAGIGFTVSIFVAGLAFDDPVLTDQATIGVLAASILAAVVGSAILLTGEGRKRCSVLTWMGMSTSFTP